MKDVDMSFVFANNLLYLIISSGRTLRDFADEVGIAETTLNNYIHGRRTPSIFVLRDMAEVLGRSMDDFFFNET